MPFLSKKCRGANNMHELYFFCGGAGAGAEAEVGAKRYIEGYSD